MKYIWFFLIGSLFCMNLYAQEDDLIKVISYNIRFAGDETKEGRNHWNNRKALVEKLIRFHHGELIGVQEALKGQINDLLKMFPEFAFIGEGRDGGSRGEFSAILFNKNIFDIIESSTFWLSETPDTISKGWDAQLNRVCTWGKFRDKFSGKIFYYFNTHFDHIGEAARQNSSRLLKKKIGQIAEGYPVILTGDFNYKSDSEGYKILTSDEVLKDAQFISHNGHFGSNVTFNNFSNSLEANNKIDFIFVNNGFEVYQHGVDGNTFDGQYPSDHMPVIAELKIK